MPLSQLSAQLQSSTQCQAAPTAAAGPSQATVVDAGVNTGGAPGGGRIIRLGAAKPKVTAERNLDTIAKRISMSTLVLQQTHMDGALRRLLLTQLIKQEVHDSHAIVMPTGALLHQVDEGVFDKYRSTLAGITPSN